MNIIEQFAQQTGQDYQDILVDYLDSTPEEQDRFIMQIGGMVSQQPTVEELIVLYAQITGVEPEAVMQQLQQLSQEDQNAAIQEMQAAVQQDMRGQSEEPLMKNGGVPVTENGYYELDPIQNPYALIPSEDITMEGLDFPINAYDGYNGQFLQTMLPGENYQFDTDLVLEEPIYAQTSGFINTDRNFNNIRSALVKNYPAFNRLASAGKLENKSDLEKAIKVFPLEDRQFLIEDIKKLDSDYNPTVNRRNLSKIMSESEIQKSINKNNSSFLNEFRQIKENRDEDFKQTQKEFQASKKEVLDKAKVLYGNLKSFSNKQLEAAKKVLTQEHLSLGAPTGFGSIPSGVNPAKGFINTLNKGLDYLFNDNVPFSLNTNTSEGKKNIEKVKTSINNVFKTLNRPSLGSPGIGGSTIFTENNNNNNNSNLEYLRNQYKEIERDLPQTTSGGNQVKQEVPKTSNTTNKESTPTKKTTTNTVDIPKTAEVEKESITTNTNDSTFTPARFNRFGKIDVLDAANSNMSFSDFMKRNKQDRIYWENPRDNFNHKALLNDLNHPQYNGSLNIASDIQNAVTGNNSPSLNLEVGNTPIDRNMSYPELEVNIPSVEEIYQTLPLINNQETLAVQNEIPVYDNIEDEFYFRALNGTEPLEDLQVELLQRYGASGMSEIQADGLLQQMNLAFARRKNQTGGYAQIGVNNGNFSMNYSLLDPIYERPLTGVSGLNNYKIGETGLNSISGIEYVSPNPGESFEEFRKRRAVSGVTNGMLNREQAFIKKEKLKKFNEMYFPTNSSEISQNKEEENKELKPLASINTGRFLQNALRNTRAAAAFSPTAPIFRGQAKYNYVDQPLIDLEPITNNIKSQFNDATRNLNTNSTTGMSVLASMQGQALDQITKAANQVAVQNNQIQAQNTRGRLQAANQQFMQQQQFDMQAYDTYLRRQASRSAGIDQAMNNIIAIDEANKQRDMMLDLIPVQNPLIKDTSGRWDRLFGRRVFSQDPKAVAEYTKQLAEVKEREVAKNTRK